MSDLLSKKSICLWLCNLIREKHKPAISPGQRLVQNTFTVSWRSDVTLRVIRVPNDNCFPGRLAVSCFGFDCFLVLVQTLTRGSNYLTWISVFKQIRTIALCGSWGQLESAMNLNDIGSVWRWILLLDFMNQTLFISYITVVHYWDLKNAHLHALGSQITFQSVLKITIFFLSVKNILLT